MKNGPRQAIEEMQPLLERWDTLPRGEPTVVTLDVLSRMDRWFVMFGMPKTATESYSPGGWRPVLGVWSSTSGLFAELADNMGGGVPIELIRALIVLAHDEWAGTPVDRSWLSCMGNSKPRRSIWSNSVSGHSLPGGLTGAR